jgi:hypothetical protein
MAGEVNERTVVDDEAVGVPADDFGPHAIIEDCVRRAADRLERDPREWFNIVLTLLRGALAPVIAEIRAARRACVLSLGLA